MDEPFLTPEERTAINGGLWFSSLSPSLRHDILRCAFVRRYQDGEQICTRGDPADTWIACAAGAVRVGAPTLAGKQFTLTYVEPGIWFGDVGLFDGERRSQDAVAHGATTILCVAIRDFHKLLRQHFELCEAFLRLQARRTRLLFGQIEDLSNLPLRARLAKQIWHLMRSYGQPAPGQPDETRIVLSLAQEELAQLVGASRQRVNQELKALEREGVIRVEAAGLVVRDRTRLQGIGAGEHP